jgi:hypothetical protein
MSLDDDDDDDDVSCTELASCLLETSQLYYFSRFNDMRANNLEFLAYFP